MNHAHSAHLPDLPLPDADRRDAVVLERRWLPNGEGALTQGVACTNVPHLVVGFSTWSFDWGHPGPGAHELALNALEHTLRASSHRGPKSRVREGDCFTLALRLRADFVNAFLVRLGQEGGVIPLSALRDWIARELGALGSAEHALLAPRYEWEGEEPGLHWSLAELEEVLDADLRTGPDGLYTATGRRVARVLDPHPADSPLWEHHPL